MYERLEISKNGLEVPVNGRTFFHSKYDPQKEAATFVSLVKPFSIAVVFGIAGGYHINALLENFPDAKIICVEDSEETLEFVEKIPNVKNNLLNFLQPSSARSNLIFCTLKNLKKTLLENYLPALYGNLSILELKSWSQYFQEERILGKKIIDETVAEIAADYSVQVHFGKLWQKNIFENLSLLKNLETENSIKLKIDSGKTAAVIAAGPSLDESIKKLKTNRDDFVIFSTDTSFTSLISYGIIPDFCISIDAQNISRRHFIKKIPQETVFVFDLCANPGAVKKILKNDNSIIFVQTSHPLSVISSNLLATLEIENIESGSGTVTIAAASFAKLLGFTKTDFYGADFSYSNGKPYCKGTYLDSISLLQSSRLSTSENYFSKIMFRTPLIKMDSQKNTEIYTTEILASYKKSLEKFLKTIKNESINNSNHFTNSPIIIEKMILKKASSISSENEKSLKKISEYLTESIEKGENVFLLPLAASTGSIKSAEDLTKKYIKYL